MSVSPRFVDHNFDSAKARAQVTKLPTREPQRPLWLRLMLLFQHGSSVFTFLTIGTALALHGWNAYTPQAWNKEYKKLANLQRQERYLTTINETLKNNLAQQAERPETGFVNPKPDQVIFISPSASPEAAEPTVAQEASAAETNREAIAPFAY